MLTLLFQFSSEIDYVKKQIADFQAETDAQVKQVCLEFKVMIKESLF